MPAFEAHKRDGTEGTATINITYKEGKKKLTLTIYGCIVKNDADLQELIREHIKQPANREKLKNTKYFFHSCDPGIAEDKITKTAVTCHRFSKPGQPKSCVLNPSPNDFVKVQEHIFVPICDSPEFNESEFLQHHSKKIRLAQDLNTTAEIYGLSYEEERNSPMFILLKLKNQSSNVYGIDEKYHENYQKLEDDGPVLLKDKKTVVGSFEKKGNNEISISIFGKSQDICLSGSGSGAVEHEQEKVAEVKSQPEDLSAHEIYEEKLEEKNMEKKTITHPEVVAGNQNPHPELDKNKKEENGIPVQLSSHAEEGAAGGQTPEPELDKKSQDNKIEEEEIEEEKGSLLPEGKKKAISKPGKLQEHDDDHELVKTKDTEQGFGLEETDSTTNECLPPKLMYHPTDHDIDSHDGFIQQQQMIAAKNDTLASQDQQKFAKNENKDILTVPLKQDQSSNYKEKLPSPIQETSGSANDFDPLEEIKSKIKDGVYDDLRQKKNKEKYRRFLLYVAQTGKWQEIGSNLDIKNEKLQILKVDFHPEGSAEQAYQMLVYWTQSDSNPTLERLLVALINTELVEEAYKVLELPTDNRSRGGKKVENTLLNKITNEVKDVWKFLGRYLGIDENDLYSIKMDNPGNTREQARQMFAKWKQRNASRATTEVLINALHDVGKSNVAKTVRAWERQA